MLNKNSLDKIKDFFQINLLIKNKIIELSLKEEDLYNETSILKYYDKLYKETKNLEYYFELLADYLFDFELTDIKEYIKDYFNKFYQNFVKVGYDRESTKKFYQTFYSDMSPTLVKRVNEEFVCYSVFFNDIYGILKNNVNSINELLHVIHSYVLNSENFYKLMPVIETKKYSNGYEINLCGEHSELAKKVFDSLNVDCDFGDTQINSLENKIFLLIRDLGHALTVEIDVENDKCYVKYFIPKICNDLMASKIPGINNFHSGDQFARGEFVIDKDNFSNGFLQFLLSIPTDNNMVFDYTSNKNR